MGDSTMRVDGGRSADQLWRSDDPSAGPAGANDGGHVAELLPYPAASASLTSITNILLLMDRTLTAQRKSAEQRRDAAEASQEQQEKRAVQEMRREADAVFSEALTSGCLSIGGGALQFVSVGMTAHADALTSGAGALEKAKGPAADAAKKSLEAAERSTNSVAKTAGDLKRTASLFKAGGDVLMSSSKPAGTIFASTAKERQADQAEHNNAAQAASRDAKRADEMASEMGELRAKVLARLEQLIDTEQQSRVAILQRA